MFEMGCVSDACGMCPFVSVGVVSSDPSPPSPPLRYGVGMCGDGANDCGVSHPMCGVTYVSVLVPRP